MPNVRDPTLILGNETVPANAKCMQNYSFQIDHTVESTSLKLFITFMKVGFITLLLY